jgi:hypothetical protein
VVSVGATVRGKYVSLLNAPSAARSSSCRIRLFGATCAVVLWALLLLLWAGDADARLVPSLPIGSSVTSAPDQSLQLNSCGATKKPLHTIIFMHGLNNHAQQYDHMQDWARACFGNVTPPMHSLPLFEGGDSLKTPMMAQRDGVVQYLVDNAAALNITAAGFNIVAHSQGAILMRAVIEALPGSFPPVLSYVSMAGPQRGQFGMCALGKANLNSTLVKYLTKGFGWLACTPRRIRT